MESAKDIAGRIRRLREDASLSQKQFGNLIGIEQSQVSKIELCENQASYSIVNAISRVFNVTTDFILKGCIATHTPSSENKFYVGYNVAMTNNLSKDAIRYLNRCIHSIQQLDVESRPDFKHGPVISAKTSDDNSEDSTHQELTRIEELERETEKLKKQLAEGHSGPTTFNQ